MELHRCSWGYCLASRSSIASVDVKLGKTQAECRVSLQSSDNEEGGHWISLIMDLLALFLPQHTPFPQNIWMLGHRESPQSTGPWCARYMDPVVGFTLESAGLLVYPQPNQVSKSWDCSSRLSRGPGSQGTVHLPSPQDPLASLSQPSGSREGPSLSTRSQVSAQGEKGKECQWLLAASPDQPPLGCFLLSLFFLQFGAWLQPSAYTVSLIQSGSGGREASQLIPRVHLFPLLRGKRGRLPDESLVFPHVDFSASAAITCLPSCPQSFFHSSPSLTARAPLLAGPP